MQYIRGNIIYGNDVGRGNTMGCHNSSLLQLSTIAMPTCVVIHCVATTLAVATTL